MPASLLYSHGVLVASKPFLFIVISAISVLYLSLPLKSKPGIIIEQPTSAPPGHHTWHHGKRYTIADITVPAIPIPHLERQPKHALFIPSKNAVIWQKLVEQCNYTRAGGSTTHYSTRWPSAEFYILATTYVLALAYVWAVMAKVDVVKSKFGLGFSALVACASSLFMSVGLWDKAGFDTMLVPWEVLPFLVIALGVENVLVLTNAVLGTSLDLAVKERVGRGIEGVRGRLGATIAGEMAVLFAGSLIEIRALQVFMANTGILHVCSHEHSHGFLPPDYLFSASTVDRY